MSGCGSDDNDVQNGSASAAAVETGSLSKEQFIQRVDSMCKETQGELLSGVASITSERSGDTSPDAEQKATEELATAVVVPAADTLISRVQAIGAPSGDEQQVQAFLTALEADRAYAEEDPLKAVDRLTPYAKAIQAAESYGLTGCVEALG